MIRINNISDHNDNNSIITNDIRSSLSAASAGAPAALEPALLV